MKKTLRNLCLISLIAFTGVSDAHETSGDSSKFVTQSITVNGAVETPLELSVIGLKSFPPQSISELPVLCQSGAETEKIDQLKGVLLKDILNKAQLQSLNHTDQRKMIIVATASDGYKAIFSWNEIFNSPSGDSVLVFFAKNGKALDDSDGRIAMISAKDAKNGVRHVKWLKNIEVRRVAD